MQTHGHHLAGAALVLGLAGLLLGACSRQPAEKRYTFKGTVVSLDKTHNQVTLSIPGATAAMSAPYTAMDATMLENLAPGNHVSGQLLIANGENWVESITVADPEGGPASAGNRRLALQGELVPDFQFVNQDGKKAGFSQYRGKTVLLTFFYTSCPLPEKGEALDGCALTTHNFAEIEHGLAENPAAYSKTRLLSISFDPQHDTPKILHEYGAAYVKPGQQAFEHWTFAAVPEAGLEPVLKFFDVFAQEQQGQFTHSSTAAIIGPDGKIVRLYFGDDWKPADVLRDLIGSLGAKA